MERAVQFSRSVQLVDRVLHLPDRLFIVFGIISPIRKPFLVRFIRLLGRHTRRSVGKQMAICLRVLGSSQKLVQIGNNIVELPLAAGYACLEFVRTIDLVKIIGEPFVVRSKMSSCVRARLQKFGQLLRGRQRHTISDPLNVESVGQKVNDPMTCKMLRQDMMNWKHATLLSGARRHPS